MIKLEKADLKNSILSGFISGTLTAITFQPFEFVKTRLQQPHHFDDSVKTNKNHLNKKNLSLIIKETLKIKDGGKFRLLNFTKFYAGLTPSLLRSIPTAGIYFTTLEYLKHSSYLFSNMGPIHYKSELLNLFLIGVIARISADVATYPLSLIKTRYESDIYNYKSIISAMNSIIKKDGFTGVFKGLGATLVRDISYSGIYFPLYTKVKQWTANKIKIFSNDDKNDYTNRQSIYFAYCALVSSILACVITQPSDVIRSYVQLRPDLYKKFFYTTKFIYGKYGIMGFFAGFWPRSTRRVLISVMSWTVYEKLCLKN